MIRCRITPKFTGMSRTDYENGESGVHLLLEWVEVVDEQIVNVLATEEFVISADRAGCAYVTRGAFDEGRLLPGTFWVDEAGHRHFVMQAEAGVIGLTGETLTDVAVKSGQLR